MCFYVGFSLASSMSTTIIHDPQKGKGKCNGRMGIADALVDRQARVLDVRNPLKERVIMTLDALMLKKVHNTHTLQEERRWLRVIVPEKNIDKVNAYLSCSNCGKCTDVPVGKAFAYTTCSKKDYVSSPRVTFNCDVSNGTGTLSITTFTEDSEKLFRMTAPDISVDQEAFKAIQELLRMS